MDDETSVATIQQDRPSPAEIMEQVVAKGDLSKLTPEERARYYVAVCKSCGLNPLTQPFDYLYLNNKLRLYPTRGAADQLRSIHKITCQIVSREYVGDLYLVHVRVVSPDGRTDEDIGTVPVKGLSATDLSNAIMKCITKAKRRATLSLLGLNMPDETEVETIPGARRVIVDQQTGEIIDDEQIVEEPSPEPILSKREQLNRKLWDGAYNLVGEEAMTILRAVARSAFGVESFRDASDSDIRMMIDAIASINEPRELYDLHEAVIAIFMAEDEESLDVIGKQIREMQMPEEARRLLRKAWARRDNELSTQKSDNANEGTSEQQGDEPPIYSWVQLWRRLKPLGINNIHDAARYLGKVPKDINSMSPMDVYRAIQEHQTA